VRVTDPSMKFYHCSDLSPLKIRVGFSGRGKCWSIWVWLILISFLFLSPSPCFAGINDDHFDGNIFALYAGNGSLIPPKVSLSDSLRLQKPALLVFYLDDSRDCKLYSEVVSNLQSYYGRVTDFIPLNIDSLPLSPSPELSDPSHYFRGKVPQTVLIDQSGKVVLDSIGNVPFDGVDAQFRRVFGLPPFEFRIAH